MVILLFLFETGDASIPYYDVPVLVEETANFRRIERLAKEAVFSEEVSHEDIVRRVLDTEPYRWCYFDERNKESNITGITGVNYILV